MLIGDILLRRSGSQDRISAYKAVSSQCTAFRIGTFWAALQWV